MHVYQSECEIVEFAIVQQVVCWLSRLKATVQIPGQTSSMKRNMKKKISSAPYSSKQISDKNSESKIKIAMQSRSNTNLLFGVHFKLQVTSLMFKMNTHNICGMRSQVVILSKGLGQLGMYVAVSFVQVELSQTIIKNLRVKLCLSFIVKIFLANLSSGLLSAGNTTIIQLTSFFAQ